MDDWLKRTRKKLLERQARKEKKLLSCYFAKTEYCSSSSDDGGELTNSVLSLYQQM